MGIVFNWFKTLILLVGELILFVINIPRYLQQFFKGIRIFSQSYTDIIKSLEDQKKRGESFRNSSPSQGDAGKIMSNWINETIRLHEEHEKMFGGLFGILIAVLALFISIVALLVRQS